jgi:hypothetical protein
MMISTYAIDNNIKNDWKFQTDISTPIDSIVIIYRNMEIAFDDFKITVSPTCGDIRFVKRSFDKLRHTSKQQKLCEWQRKEIFESIIGIYVTGRIKIGEGKQPTRSDISATPPEMYVTIYSGGDIRQEHLTIYYIEKDNEYRYSDDFIRLSQLLDVLLLVLKNGLPVVC